MTSSIRIAQVFPELVGKKTHAIGMLKYITDYVLYLAHYDAYFLINDDVQKCRYRSVTNNYIFSHNSLNCYHLKYCKKYVMSWKH